MAETISIANLPPGTPTSDDILVFVDRADGITKRANESTLPIPDSVQTAINASNPDFYQYSIVRTVASGNLTVALKNYEGNDPTPTAPVKIMIGGVVRTITSALGFTKNSGINYLNLGSAELATKEADIFVYLIYDLTDSIVKILGGRIPYATTLSDFNYAITPEKGILEDDGITNNGASPVVNIGRFNATLSAGGAGYTWSIPATSVIVNKPINETRWLEWTPTYVGFFGNMTVTGTVSNQRYKIVGNTIKSIIQQTGLTTGGIAETQLTYTLPMSASYFSSGCGQINDAGYKATSIVVQVGNKGWISSSVALGNWGLGGSRELFFSIDIFI